MRKALPPKGQTIDLLQGHGPGAKCADPGRKHGMSEDTFHAGKARYSGMTVSETKRLRALEDENAKPSHASVMVVSLAA